MSNLATSHLKLKSMCLCLFPCVIIIVSRVWIRSESRIVSSVFITSVTWSKFLLRPLLSRPPSPPPTYFSEGIHWRLIYLNTPPPHHHHPSLISIPLNPTNKSLLCHVICFLLSQSRGLSCCSAFTISKITLQQIRSCSHHFTPGSRSVRRDSGSLHSAGGSKDGAADVQLVIGEWRVCYCLSWSS